MKAKDVGYFFFEAFLSCNRTAKVFSFRKKVDINSKIYRQSSLLSARGPKTTWGLNNTNNNLPWQADSVHVVVVVVLYCPCRTVFCLLLYHFRLRLQDALKFYVSALSSLSLDPKLFAICGRRETLMLLSRGDINHRFYRPMFLLCLSAAELLGCIESPVDFCPIPSFWACRSYFVHVEANKFMWTFHRFVWLRR